MSVWSEMLQTHWWLAVALGLAVAFIALALVIRGGPDD